MIIRIFMFGINQIILIMNAIYIQLNLQKMTLPLMLE